MPFRTLLVALTLLILPAAPAGAQNIGELINEVSSITNAVSGNQGSRCWFRNGAAKAICQARYLVTDANSIIRPIRKARNAEQQALNAAHSSSRGNSIGSNQSFSKNQRLLEACAALNGRACQAAGLSPNEALAVLQTRTSVGGYYPARR